MDQIVIEGLELMAHIGVPDDERDRLQRLTVSAVLTPESSFRELDERLDRTVDYACAAESIRKLAGERPWRLLETLCVAIAEMLVRDFALRQAGVEVRKFVLSDTEYVAVRTMAHRSPPAASKSH